MMANSGQFPAAIKAPGGGEGGGMGGSTRSWDVCSSMTTLDGLAVWSFFPGRLCSFVIIACTPLFRRDMVAVFCFWCVMLSDILY